MDVENTPAAPAPHKLSPLPYHRELADYLKNDESALWEWFTTHRPRSAQADSVRLELLKSTYRIAREQKTALYDLAEGAARALGLSCPITLYQAQNFEKQNVSLAYLPGEAHVVFHGPVQDSLTEDELRAVFAHELTHFLLYDGWNGEFGVVEQILHALANDAAVETTHLETLRLYALYSELLADRGSYLVSQNPLLAISGILKLEVGDREVSAESYLQQAQEIFARENPSSLGATHPETFIRTRALQLWSESPEEADAKVRELIEGPARFASLDLLRRKRVTGLTRRLIELLLAPRWIQTERVLAHARLFFEDFSPLDEEAKDEHLAADLETKDEELRRYYGYVLLDFIAADRDLEEAPLAAALELADSLGLGDELERIAAKELKLEKRRIEKVRRQAPEILRKAREGARS